MRNQTMWDLRDARTLDIYEKMFLLTVESRGKSFTEREKAWADMAMSKNKYYAVRTSLINRELLVANERTGTTTEYTVNAEAVAALVPVPSQGTGGVPQEGTGASHDKGRGRTTTGDHKKNNKKNQKKNVEEEQEEILSDKEDLNDEPLPIGLDQESPISSKEPAPAAPARVTDKWKESQGIRTIKQDKPWYEDPYWSEEAIAAREAEKEARKAADPVNELVW